MNARTARTRTGRTLCRNVIVFLVSTGALASAVYTQPAFEAEILAAPEATEEASSAVAPGVTRGTSNTLVLGQTFQLALHLSADEGELDGPPRFPVWSDTWGEAEVVAVRDLERARLEGQRIRYTQRVDLQLFRLGKVVFPAVQARVPFDGETLVLTNRKTLEVTVNSSIDGPVEEAELQPAKAPVSLPLGLPFWATVATLLCVCLAASPSLLRYRPRPGTRAERSPLMELRAALSEPESNSARSAHVLVSFALRRYLARALAWPALESTTSEIRVHLQQSGLLPSALAEQVVRLLARCDDVKFARMPLDPEQIEQGLRATESVAEAIDRVLHLSVLQEEEAPLSGSESTKHGHLKRGMS